MSSYGPAKKQSRAGADSARRTIAPYHAGGGAGPLGAPKSAAAAAASSVAAKQKSASGAPDSRSQGFMFSASQPVPPPLRLSLDQFSIRF